MERYTFGGEELGENSKKEQVENALVRDAKTETERSKKFEKIQIGDLITVPGDKEPMQYEVTGKDSLTQKIEGTKKLEGTNSTYGQPFSVDEIIDFYTPKK
jgi:hypothetical protein